MFICPNEDHAISHEIAWRPVAGMCSVCRSLVCGQCGQCQCCKSEWTVVDRLPDGSPKTLTWRGSSLKAAAGRALNIGRH